MHQIFINLFCSSPAWWIADYACGLPEQVFIKENISTAEHESAQVTNTLAYSASLASYLKHTYASEMKGLKMPVMIIYYRTPKASCLRTFQQIFFQYFIDFAINIQLTKPM